MMKKLIVNADDLGLTKEINQGIFLAHRKGIVTASSICASGRAFEDAIEQLPHFPDLDLGIHLTLVSEKSVLPHAEIPTLVDRNGHFRKSAYRFARDYFLQRINVMEVKKELDAQILKTLQSGVQISHIDSHQHVHVLPEVLTVTKELAGVYDVDFIRAPFETMTQELFSQKLSWPRTFMQFLLNGIFHKSRSRLFDNSIAHFYGFSFGGQLNINRLNHIIQNLPEGTSELMCHPGAYGCRYMKRYKNWGYDWWGECQALMDRSIQEMIWRHGVTLATFQSTQRRFC